MSFEDLSSQRSVHAGLEPYFSLLGYGGHFCSSRPLHRDSSSKGYYVCDQFRHLVTDCPRRVMSPPSRVLIFRFV